MAAPHVAGVMAKYLSEMSQATEVIVQMSIINGQ